MDHHAQELLKERLVEWVQNEVLVRLVKEGSNKSTSVPQKEEKIAKRPVEDYFWIIEQESYSAVQDMLSNIIGLECYAVASSELSKAINENLATLRPKENTAVTEPKIIPQKQSVTTSTSDLIIPPPKVEKSRSPSHETIPVPKLTTYTSTSDLPVPPPQEKIDIQNELDDIIEEKFKLEKDLIHARQREIEDQYVTEIQQLREAEVRWRSRVEELQRDDEPADSESSHKLNDNQIIYDELYQKLKEGQERIQVLEEKQKELNERTFETPIVPVKLEEPIPDEEKHDKVDEMTSSEEMNSSSILVYPPVLQECEF
jgi:hypothetical protein